MIVSGVLCAHMIHVLLAENHEPIEALLLDGLDEPLHEGVRLGTGRRKVLEFWKVIL